MSLGWFPESELFPEVTSPDSEVFEMEYFPKVRSLKNNLEPEQYAIYKELRGLDIGHVTNKFDSYSAWYAAFGSITCEELRETMREALDACSNAGSDIEFEISPRNVAAKKGKLILLDCFFSLTALERVRGRDD